MCAASGLAPGELGDRRHVDCIWLKVTHIQLAEMSLSYTGNDINMSFCHHKAQSGVGGQYL